MNLAVAFAIFAILVVCADVARSALVSRDAR